jgi:non-specific serine/threonine protein kinase
LPPALCGAHDVDGRSDVYSLGCVLYEMVSGRTPFRSDSPLALMNQHVTRTPEPLADIVPDVPAAFAAVVATALAKRPADRFHTAAELARALADALERPRPTDPNALTVEVATGDTGTVIPTLLTRHEVPNNLPQELTSFVGRDAEAAEARALLAASRALTLTGPGGIGKTRLALRVASDAVDEFPDGVWAVDLASLTEPALVPNAVAAAVGAREAPGATVTSTLADAIGSRRMLVVLDNCEHVVAACAALAGALLRACPRLGLLATSREALNLVGETVYRVPPLGSGGDGADDAVTLFVDRLRAGNPRLVLAENDLEVVAGVCRRLDGLPLAIELAAARGRVLSLEQILARLDDRFRLLAGGDRTAMPRQQTMRAAIDWSYDLLDEDERALLRRLSVFAGGCTIDAVEAVASAEVDVLDTIAHLADKSLVVVDAAGAEARYRLLETIREYASERLAESGEADELRARHRHFFLAFAEGMERELKGPREAEAVRRLDAEHDNLRAALRSCAAAGDPAACLRLATALAWFWGVRGHWSEARARLAEALAAATDGPPETRSKALNVAGSLAAKQGELAGARAMYEESLALRRELGDERGIANTLHNLAILMREQGELDRAAPFYEESHDLYRKLGEPRNIAISLNSIASLAVDRGDYARAEAAIREGLDISRSVGYTLGVGTALHNLGELAHRRGELDEAARCLEQSRANAATIGYRELEAASTFALGRVALDAGDPDRARSLFVESLDACRRLGHRAGIADALEGLACVAAAKGDAAHANRMTGAVTALRDEIHASVPSLQAALVERWLAPAREHPGAADAIAAGRRMGIERALDEALVC